jgi:hypothetical protein
MVCYVEVDIIMVNKSISYHPWLLVNIRKEDGVYRPCCRAEFFDVFAPAVVEKTWRFVPKRS